MRRLLDFGIEEHSLALRWGFALLAFAVALGVRLAVDDMLPPGFPYLTFFPAVIVTTFIYGVAPGVAVAIASGLASWYFFMEPVHTFVVTGATILALGFFSVIVAVDILLIHIMHLALRRLRAESARQSRERELSQQLAASREVMFKELQHRISNNLQVLAALMTLRRGAVRDVAAQRILDQATERLELLGRIHRRLHDPSGQRIAFGLFLESLCDDVLQAAGATRVQVAVAAEPLVLSPEQTVPVALIVTELVSNALEHGFAEGQRPGRIHLALTREAEGGMARLTVANDGAPLREDFDPARSESLGLKIVAALAQQVGGRFEMQAAPQGTVSRLTFPLEQAPPE
ncbi:DUF4118 domain-containing protein [Roseomonas sp. E05]|uniref:sensor histidine kinase n=1 Tax=Roseomonas sp. E05 TaxID=3046310 RepID=UPI0024B95AE3|nr:DUF4118 domain-containing protein [Roseomonas sp. E05]MDJ0386608.1 DUF4118 domain-containing protein [Roseomonas sp. E05]